MEGVNINVPILREAITVLVLLVLVCIIQLDVKVLLQRVFDVFNLIYLDINECASNNGGCDHHCHNTAGTYSCSCDSGYSLASNGHSCVGNVQFI